MAQHSRRAMIGGMPSRSVQFDDWLWEALDREARANRTSVAEFVRRWALAGVTVSAVRRGAPHVAPGLELVDQAQAMLDAQTQQP